LALRESPCILRRPECVYDSSVVTSGVAAYINRAKSKAHEEFTAVERMMPGETSPFPLVAEFLEQKVGTLYVLCDSPVRIRDAVSVIALTRFFAAAAVRLDVRPILTTHRRYLSARNLREVASEARAEEFETARAAGASLHALIDQLFSWAESSGRNGSEDEKEIEELAPRGPLIVLGRPQLYPDSFNAAIERELVEVNKGLYGRFITPYNDIEHDDPRFWSVLDQYYNVMHRVAPPHQSIRDYGIIRKVRGLFASRTILFAYGTSSLGTIGATQMLIDADQNERLIPLRPQEYLAAHGETEILIAVERAASARRSRTTLIGSEYAAPRPRELRVFLGPSAPISKEAAEWIRLLTTDPDNERVAQVYRHEGSDEVTTRFAVIGCHPANAISARMIGGEQIGDVVERLRGLGRDLSRTPVLLVGPTGVGKELAARIIHEERVLALLKSVSKEGFAEKYFPPDAPVLEAVFGAVNCAGMTEGLAEARLFGIKENTATEVAPSPGVILASGVGTAFLDEISFTNEIQQGRLLRAIEPPYEVTPLGFSGAIRYGSLIVAAMSSDPEDRVREGKFLPELLARFNAGLVRIPRLSEHPGDIPALLCAIAGGPIAMDENVLRCLLANDHPLNVRGLFSVVSRALGPRRQVAASNGLLAISLNDLGASNELRKHFELGETSERPRTFVFCPAMEPVVAGDVFNICARALTSIAEDNGRVQLRKPLEERKRELGATGFQHLSGAFDAWMSAVQRIVEEVPNRNDDGILRKLLSRAGNMSNARFGTNISESVRTQLLQAKQRVPALSNRHAAHALHRNEAFFRPGQY
jgi:transcriptional regulator with AAA-type ATPase domain